MLSPALLHYITITPAPPLTQFHTNVNRPTPVWNTHSYLLPLLMDMLPFTDDIHKRSASFITARLKSDSTIVRSVAEFGILVGRCDSILGRNTLLCCSHFGWKFDDFVCGSNTDLSNDTLLCRHHTLVNSCDWHTMQFLSEIINVRDVFSL